MQTKHQYVKYIYNEQTMRFEPKKNFKDLIKNKVRLFKYSFFSIIAIFILTFACPKLYYFLLQYNQDQLLTVLKNKDKKISIIESELKTIHKRDQGIYRSILNTPPIDEDVWKGGRGGFLREFPFTGNKFADNFVSRIQSLKYQLTTQEESYNNIFTIAHQKSEELTMIPALQPVNGAIVSGFGYRVDPFSGGYHFHQGLDIVSPIGTPILASADGTVEAIGDFERGYGLQIILKHGSTYSTRYAHLSRIFVNVGDSIKRGDKIGLTGNSGYSTGPHLHYEVFKNSVTVDPLGYCLTR